MNRLVTHEGRMPIWLDDLDFMQDAVAGEISKAIKGLTGIENDVVIFSGCEKSELDGGGCSFSKGVIYYQGNLYVVDACTFNSSGAFVFDFDDTYDENGNRNLLDGDEDVACYKIPVARIALKRMLISRPDSRPLVAGAKRWDDILRRKTSEKIILDNDYENDDNTLCHVKLVKINLEAYLLSFQYSGPKPQFTIELPHETAYELGYTTQEHDSVNLHENFWASGRTMAPCSCVYRAPDDDGYAFASAYVEAVSNSNLDRPGYLRISVEGEKLSVFQQLPTIQQNAITCQGGFTMLLTARKNSILL